jgi:hypothetical protein
MIEVINDQRKRVLIFINEISYVEEQRFRGCSIYMRNGNVIHTESISYNTLIKEIKEASNE